MLELEFDVGRTRRGDARDECVQSKNDEPTILILILFFFSFPRRAVRASYSLFCAAFSLGSITIFVVIV